MTTLSDITSKKSSLVVNENTVQKLQVTTPTLHPIVWTCVGTFVVLNVGVLLSIPPVLLGRGAPYLPTFQKNMDAMFHQLKKEPRFQNRITQRCTQQQQSTVQLLWKQNSKINLQRNIILPRQQIRQPLQKNQQQQVQQKHEQKERITFVDLGSGDGRLVFRAQKEQLFDVCIGYEINPFLHLLALLQQMPIELYNKYLSLSDSFYRRGQIHSHHKDTNLKTPSTTTQQLLLQTTTARFLLRNLWDVDLTTADVVAVYGLAPIMKELGKKLETELKPGSYVLSNVFTFPGWIPISTLDGTYIYKIPERKNVVETIKRND